jgi:saccharopine dehydrogenase-like NADP-dependent oxidoreductase
MRALLRHRPFALVDAAGPFQGSGYEAVRAALSAGCHFLDIADGRAFVTGIAALDAEARRRPLRRVRGFEPAGWSRRSKEAAGSGFQRIAVPK